MTQPSLLDLPQTVYAAHHAEITAEAHRLASAKDRILSRLRKGTVTNVELNAIAFRFGARILELRHAGYDIETERVDSSLYLYTLRQEPDHA